MKKKEKEKRYDDQDVGQQRLTPRVWASLSQRKRARKDPSDYENSQQESSTDEVCGPIKNIPGFFVSAVNGVDTRRHTDTRVSRYIHSQLERGNLN